MPLDGLVPAAHRFLRRRSAAGLPRSRRGTGDPTSRARWSCCARARVRSGTAGCGLVDSACRRPRESARRPRSRSRRFERSPALEAPLSATDRPALPEGREPGRRRALRHHGPDDRGVGRRDSCWRCSASRPNSRASSRCRRRAAVWGIDSGIRHAVTGADYGIVRIGAFMGYRILAELPGLPLAPGRVRAAWRSTISDGDGYLANVTAGESQRRFAHAAGADGGRRLSSRDIAGSTDARDAVDPARSYAVRDRDRPSGVRARLAWQRFRASCWSGRRRDEDARRARRADVRIARELLRLRPGVRRHGPAGGVGARGGAGRRRLRREDHRRRQRRHGGGARGGGTPRGLDAIANRYQGETGRKATVFSNSSSAARHGTGANHALSAARAASLRNFRSRGSKLVEGGTHATSRFDGLLRRDRSGHRCRRLRR